MIRRTCLCLLVAACAGHTPPPASPAAAAPPVKAAAAPSAGVDEEESDLRFLSDLVQTRHYTLGRPVKPRFLPDGSQLLFLRSGARSSVLSLYSFDVATGQTRELLSPAAVLQGGEEQLGPEERARRERMRVTLSGFTSFDIARDGKAILVTLSGKVYVVPLATGKAIEVAGPDAQGHPPFDARLSPDGKLVAFVRGNELWVAPAGGGPAHPVAKAQGEGTTVAQAEFVAQEEMDRFRGYWWSPDSSELAYEVADATHVEKLFVGDPSDPTADAGPAPYPRPGHPNVDASLLVVGVKGGKATPVPWERQRYPYLAEVVWEEGGPLTVEVMTRDQKDLLLLAADPRTGKTRELLREHDDVWLNLPRFAWLRDGSGLLWTTERNGAWQLELRAPDGKLEHALTPPEIGFRRFDHVDETRKMVIFTAAPEPVDSRLWSVPLAGGDPQPLTAANENVTADYADRSEAYVLLRTAVDRLYDPEVHRADGSVAGTLASVAEKVPAPPRVEIQKIGPAPGYWTSIVRPRDFDPKKKYPVIVHVYGGPHVTVVHRSLLAYVESQFLADHGFIVVSVDNRGTPGRGRAWERELFGKLGEVPLDGQVTGLRALAAKEPAMDLGRVGIFGHSFGGFMSALAVEKRPDVYRAGVASAPVSDWLEYDTFYTERYLGVPDLKAPELYDKNGLLAYAKDLKRPLLIIHGTADDNVHFVHALKLVDALFRGGRPYEFLTLAHTTHLPHDPALMLRYYQRIVGFLRRNL